MIHVGTEPASDLFVKKQTISKQLNMHTINHPKPWLLILLLALLLTFMLIIIKHYNAGSGL